MPASSPLHGVLFMLASTALFVLGDSFMKLASEAIPPFQLVILRAAVAILACVIAITAMAQWRQAGALFNGRTLLRGLAESGAAIFFMLGLANLPIADAFAIAQTVPLFLLLGAVIIYGDRLTPLQGVLALLGFGGALLVAKPGFDGVSWGFVFATCASLCVAARDLIGRGVAPNIPVAVVSCATSIFTIILAAGPMAVAETWQSPTALQWLYILGAGLCVAAGQIAVVLAYRRANTATLAPLFYSFALWSVLSGFLVWGQLPDLWSTLGIALIVATGLLLVRLGQRPERAA